MAPVDRRSFLSALPFVTVFPPAGWGQFDAPLLPFIELDHVSFRVSNVQRTARFYMRLFGTDAARDPHRQANPGSQAGELWFIRCGRSHIALAPLSRGEEPGIDHYCLSVRQFDKSAAQATLRSFDQPYPDWPSNNVWLRDPDGMLVQLAPSANDPQLPTIVRNATAVPRPADTPETAPFRASRIAKLVLTANRLAATTGYYGRLLGGTSSPEARSGFTVGPSRLIISSREVQSFRIAVRGFEPQSALRALARLDAPAEPASGGSIITVHDPDGIRFEVAAP
jgi:catechol 2,3-dioxygenase-like lactoylglutathione lyase family enzyme